VGAQVISWLEARGHWVMMFVLYFSVENLATLIADSVCVGIFLSLHANAEKS
jgi:hypothetical protein